VPAGVDTYRVRYSMGAGALLVLILVATSSRAVDILEVLRQVFHKCGTPKYLRSDNSSAFTARAVATWPDDHQTGPPTIQPG
jgi:hypothetical protein